MAKMRAARYEFPVISKCRLAYHCPPARRPMAFPAGLRSDELLDVLHEPQRYIIGRGLEITLGIDPDNGLCIGSAEMYPVIIKLYFQAILRIDGMIFIFLFDPVKDSRDIDTFFQLDLVLGNEIIRIPGPERADPIFMV